MPQIKIGITGCLGRMGKALTAAVLDNCDTVLVGGTEMATHPEIGKFIRHPMSSDQTDVKITSDSEELILAADVILDFTCPTATKLHATLAEKNGTAIVIGTTGLNSDDEAVIKATSKSNTVVYASNYSTGVNLLFYLTRQAASVLDDEFDIEILEMHHRDKVDAPSGTALSLGIEAALGRNVKLTEVMDAARDGISERRKTGNIGFASLRGGNVAGEHTVSFSADDERIEIIHKAGDRIIFARGAVKAALWVYQQKAGLYDMFDVLGLPKK